MKRNLSSDERSASIDSHDKEGRSSHRYRERRHHRNGSPTRDGQYLHHSKSPVRVDRYYGLSRSPIRKEIYYRSSKSPGRDGRYAERSQSSLRDGRHDVSRSPLRINLEKFYEKSSVRQCDIGDFETLCKIGSKESIKSSSSCSEKNATSNNEKVINSVSKGESEDKSVNSIVNDITENAKRNNDDKIGTENESSFFAAEKENIEVMEELKQLEDNDTEKVEPEDDEHVNQEKPFHGWSREAEPRCGMPWVEQDYSTYDLHTSFREKLKRPSEVSTDSDEGPSPSKASKRSTCGGKKTKSPSEKAQTPSKVSADSDEGSSPSNATKLEKTDNILQSNDKTSCRPSSEPILLSENNNKNLASEQENYEKEETVNEEIEDDEVQILKEIQGNPKFHLASMVSVQAEVKTEPGEYDTRSNLGPWQNVTIDRPRGTVILKNPPDTFIMDRPHNASGMDGLHFTTGIGRPHHHNIGVDGLHPSGRVVTSMRHSTTEAATGNSRERENSSEGVDESVESNAQVAVGGAHGSNLVVNNAPALVGGAHGSNLVVNNAPALVGGAHGSNLVVSNAPALVGGAHGSNMVVNNAPAQVEGAHGSNLVVNNAPAQGENRVARRFCGLCSGNDKVKINMEIELSTAQLIQVAQALPRFEFAANNH